MNRQFYTELAVGSVEKDVGGQRHHAFVVCYARVWIGTPIIQLVSRGNAAASYIAAGEGFAGVVRKCVSVECGWRLGKCVSVCSPMAFCVLLSSLSLPYSPLPSADVHTPSTRLTL